MTAVGKSNAFQHTANVLFCHAGTAKSHRSRVHFVADGGSFFQLDDFFLALEASEFDHGVNEFEGSGFALLGVVNAEQVGDGEHGVVTIGRQEVDASSGLSGLFHTLLKGCHVNATLGAGFFRHGFDGMDGTIPHNVVNVNLIACQPNFPALGVQQCCETGAVLAEEIEEGAVLTILISIGRIVHRTLVVAEKNYQSVADRLAESLSSLDVSFFGK